MTLTTSVSSSPAAAAAAAQLFFMGFVQSALHSRKLRRRLCLFFQSAVAIVSLFALFTYFFLQDAGGAGGRANWTDRKQKNHQKSLFYHHRKRIYENTASNAVIWSPIQQSIHNSSNDDRIFFHETSGRMELSFKETCAVESAAIHNPQRPVQIFFQPQQLQQLQQQSTAAAIDQSSAWIRVLNRYANVQVIVIDDEGLYFKDSPLEDWYREGKWRNSPYRATHMSDYIRVVSLMKQGGMYLDLDVLTLKPYDGPQFRNFLTYGSARMEYLSNTVFHFEKGHGLIDYILRVLAEDYDAETYGFNGVATSLAAAWRCNMTQGRPQSNTCRDVHLLPDTFFFPIGTPFIGALFQQQSQNRRFIDDHPQLAAAHGLHLANSVTHNLTIHLLPPTYSSTDDGHQQPQQQQPFVQLAARHCPFTLSLVQLFASAASASTAAD